MSLASRSSSEDLRRNNSITPRSFFETDHPRLESFAEKMWSLPVLYDNPDGRIFQKIRLVGRYHGQYGNVRASQGNWDGWEDRRKRVGLVVDFLDEFRFRVADRVRFDLRLH